MFSERVVVSIRRRATVIICEPLAASIFGIWALAANLPVPVNRRLVKLIAAKLQYVILHGSTSADKTQQFKRDRQP